MPSASASASAAGGPPGHRSGLRRSPWPRCARARFGLASRRPRSSVRRPLATASSRRGLGLGDERVDHGLHVDAVGLGDLGDGRAVAEGGAELLALDADGLGGGVEAGAEVARDPGRPGPRSGRPSRSTTSAMRSGSSSMAASRRSVAAATMASITVWTSTPLASATWAIDWPSSRAVRSSSSVMPMASAAASSCTPRPWRAADAVGGVASVVVVGARRPGRG